MVILLEIYIHISIMKFPFKASNLCKWRKKLAIGKQKKKSQQQLKDMREQKRHCNLFSRKSLPLYLPPLILNIPCSLITFFVIFVTIFFTTWYNIFFSSFFYQSFPHTQFFPHPQPFFIASSHQAFFFRTFHMHNSKFTHFRAL